jgi:hypothetical protein
MIPMVLRQRLVIYQTLQNARQQPIYIPVAGASP